MPASRRRAWRAAPCGRRSSGRRWRTRPTYSESLHAQLQYGWAPLHALRTARFKLIEAPRVELYDLQADGGETTDRVRRASRPGSRRCAASCRRSWPRTTPVATQAIDAETAERLDALGYLGGGGGASAPAPTGRDPKDGIGLVTRLGRNGMSVARTDPQKAIRELTALLAEDPGMLVVLRTRAVAYETAGQYEAAIRDLRAAREEGRAQRRGQRRAGRQPAPGRAARRRRWRCSSGRPARTRASRSRGSRWPRSSSREAGSARRRPAYEKVLEIAPTRSRRSGASGDLALIRGDLEDGAARRYGRILEMDPADAGALSKLGVVRVRTGRADEGIALFRKAVEREPRNAEALLYLAGALASSGRPAEAVPYFERALAAGPPSTMALNGLGLTRLPLGDPAGPPRPFADRCASTPTSPTSRRRCRDLGRP